MAVWSCLHRMFLATEAGSEGKDPAGVLVAGVVLPGDR